MKPRGDLRELVALVAEIGRLVLWQFGINLGRPAPGAYDLEAVVRETKKRWGLK